MAIGANITVWLPFLALPIGGTAVPLSLQTFFAIIAGLMLGKKRGSFAMITYVLIESAGLPVFAQMKAGLMPFMSPTGGFIMSFIAVAFVTGWVAEQTNKPSTPIYSIAALSGLIVNYSIGVTYMYAAMNTWLESDMSYTVAWSSMTPFLIKDAGLTCLAALFTVNLIKRLPLASRKAARIL